MGVVEQYFAPEEALFGSIAPPQYVKTNGSSLPVSGLAYDSSSFEAAYWKWCPFHYGSGNITVNVIWYADTSTTSTHGVTWITAVAAITPGVDLTNVESKNFGSQASASTDLGSADAQKLMKTTLTITSLDSIAAGDECWLQIMRSPSDASDDLTGDAIVTSVRVSYSDT